MAKTANKKIQIKLVKSLIGCSEAQRKVAKALGFTKKDNAFFLKLMSEAYDRIGDPHTAAMCLQKAILLDSSINVSEKLKRKYR